MRIRRFLPAVLPLLLLVPAAPARPADDPILVTLARVKSAYRDKKYPEADEALRNLAELLAAPEREPIRPRVLPVLHFYTAAVAFARKDEDRARASLRQFFEIEPNANLDPAAYPKSFRIFFEAQRTEFEKSASPPGPGAIGGGVLPDFTNRDVDLSAIPANNGSPDWAEGPVKFLMTEEEKRAFRALSDDDARRSFVNEFWLKRDAEPNTPANEFQVEFYRRAQYADAAFSTEAVRGSLSDRGMVFVLLGPPSYVGRAAIRPRQDPMTVMRARGSGIAVTPGSTAGEMETWYYRKDHVLRGLPYSELQYRFISQRGYGTSVLQKDPIPLTALTKAARLLRGDR